MITPRRIATFTIQAVLLLALLTTLTTTTALAGNTLGELQTSPTQAVDDRNEPASAEVVRELTDPMLIVTHDEPRLAALDNGQKIFISPHSTLFLEGVGGAVVQASVRRGTVSVRDAAGNVRLAGKNSLFQLGPMGPVPEINDLTDTRRSKR